LILSDKYKQALAFAFDLHRTQERKGSGTPYVAHILGVSSMALEYGATEDEAIAALLHDAAEDQGGETVLLEIEMRFGSAVAGIVRECTDAVEEPKPPWKNRKIRYLEHLRSASASASLIASCDKLYNLRAIVADYRTVGEDLWGRFAGGKAGVLWYYRELGRALVMPKPLQKEFSDSIFALESLIGN
jgi:(p)ppGpp synthase/HD superfamily hydrolase